MEAREAKALDITANSKLTYNGRVWTVPSQHSTKRYTVNLQTEPPTCTCADYETRAQKCKHILAAEYHIASQSGERLPVAEPPVRPTYKQEWTAYHKAQTNEKAKFQLLLHELCRGIEEPIQTAGRPRLPLSDVIFASAFKIYSTISCRRFATDLREAHAKGYLTKLPSYNSIFDYFKTESMTAYLKQLIVESSLPLKSVEVDFAADSSGFSTNRFVRWFDVKYGNTEDWRDWVKLHVMCGVKTNVVTSVEVSRRYAGDSPYFKPLLETTSRNFQMREVSADKAYLSGNNMRLVLVKGAVPYIPFKSNSTTNQKSTVWNRLYHFYNHRRDEFNEHYHKRSNVESTFSMIKAKFGERLRSKDDKAQVNEALCKVLCHNLCCVIQSMYELGIDPVFRLESETPAR